MQSLMEYINLWIVLGAFVIGLIYSYLTSNDPIEIVKYPTPYNAGKITYVDDAGVCYRYKVKKVTCPVDKSVVKNIKIQENGDGI